MSKLTTADVQKFLATDPNVQRIVREDRCGIAPDGTPDADDDGTFLKWAKDATDPKKWVRRRKYSVGSKTDMEEGIQLGDGFQALDPKDRPPDLTGGIVREFWLRDTDHVTILTVEKDGKIIFIEDLSD